MMKTPGWPGVFIICSMIRISTEKLHLFHIDYYYGGVIRAFRISSGRLLSTCSVYKGVRMCSR